MSTWIVPLLGVDFQNDFDKLLIDYIETNYNITDPVKTGTDYLRFAAGYFDFNEVFDYNQPYEIVAIEPTNATRREQELGNAGRSNNMSTLMEVNIRMQRLTEESGIAPQLGYMEREVIRIIGQYRPHDIVGIRDIVWEGGGRLFSDRDWRTQILCKLFYEKRNVAT